MSKHTKGPWHVGVGNGEGSVFADEGRARMEQGGTTLYPICNVNRGWDDAEDAANARLIASAPQMLEALSDILHEVTHDIAGLPRDELLDVVSAVRELAEAAIAKATEAA